MLTCIYVFMIVHLALDYQLVCNTKSPSFLQVPIAFSVVFISILESSMVLTLFKSHLDSHVDETLQVWPPT